MLQLHLIFKVRRELATMWRKWLDRYLRVELVALIIIFLWSLCYVSVVYLLSSAAVRDA